MKQTARAAPIGAAPSAPAIASYLYGLFGECFGYPDEELVLAVQSGDLRRTLDQQLSTLDPALTAGLDLSGLSDQAADLETLAVEYTRLFDANDRGTACSLNGGLHFGSQMKVMEEAVRFYDYFELTLTEGNKELPDHLSTQLNFLHFLSYAEADLQRSGESPLAYQRARRDFIARQPGRWLPSMAEKLAALNAAPFFHLLSVLLVRLLKHEQSRLECLHGAASLEPVTNYCFSGL